MKPITHLLATAIVALLPALALGFPSVASAVPLTLDNPLASFSNPQSVSGDLDRSNIAWPDGVNGDEIRFGMPTSNSHNPGHQQSGLRFDLFAAPFTVNTGEIFDLGTLTHFNWEVKNGTSITGADLTFSFDVSGAHPPRLSSLFNLGVDETNNQKAGCAITPVVPPGNWCPDIISFPQMGGASTFTLDGQTFALNLLGFGPTANDLQNNFITQEFQDNTTHLWAIISLPATQVPEPGSLLMMALGLFGLGGLLTYRQKKRKDGTLQA